MSHSTSYRTPIESSRAEGPAVRSALKATLAAALATEASTTKGDTATPEHLASPGRLRTTLRT
jgi:hypothetical protein